ncbi:ABC transporter permease [Cellulomonas aerilata]|uniref:ABC transporter permease n=1 Tax=Cellulomonas aerilata TaxID=515326 RepID=A0A512DCJ6_9CELL|nr:ABC transporter permease [Cellulomonas aerilata]GEO34202.1 ABC transporter permease [Cellulomonas aerilata]
MSAAEQRTAADVGDPAPGRGATPARRSPAPATTAVRGGWLRFLRSELWLVYGRRRNWVGALVLASVPVIIAVAVRVSPPSGGGPGFFDLITANGLFVALAALTLELPLFLPIAVATIAGDAVAGEANLGTLRYLLVVPVDRTRLLVVKFAALVIFTVSATLLVAAVGAVMGLVLFGGGPMLTLSGTTVSFAAGLGRLALVCAYLSICLVALGAIGLFISTLTEQPIGATIAVLVLTLASQIMDAIPQLSAIHEYLPTHYWLAFGDLLRDPIALDGLEPGIVSALAYTAVFTTAAWARFTTRDISS